MKRSISQASGTPVCKRLKVWLFAATLVVSVFSAIAETPKLTPQQTEFFEKKVQPILSAHCYDCHSHGSEKIRGSLVLDTREGILKGGDTGPAVVPGDAEKSLLIKAVRYSDDDLLMPPKGKKLSDTQISTLEEWVKMGAPDPREGKAYATVEIEGARSHWAFQPVKQPPVPKVKNSSWPRTPVDNFILAKLDENKLKPSAPADKRTLIRRATFDLIGLPPTPEEVDAFVKDKSPDAFAKVVDRLLASPHYGERWGRHWLDVARYADTKGDQGNRGAETRFIYAYTYRDYVIRSFNEDKPFNQFIIEQIAADKLQLDDKRDLAALGFLTVGNRFRNAVNEVIDDQIDVVTRGIMGLTVSCARCHDHKFDPVPTADYYSMHGIFASTTEPAELPMIQAPKDSAAYDDFKKKLAAAEETLAIAQENNLKEIRSIIRNKVGDYLLATYELEHGETNVSKNVFYSSRKLSATVGGKWERSLRKWKADTVFAPWIALSKLPEKDFAKLASKTLSKLKNDSEINPLVFEALSEPALQTHKEASERYGKLFKELDEKISNADKKPELAKKGFGDAKDSSGLDSDWLALEEVLSEKGAPLDVESREVRGLTSQQTERKLNELTRKVNDIKIKHLASPHYALAVEDIAKPRDSAVFIRGNAGNRGAVVPRQFLEILSDGERKPFRNGSGRLELAQQIASDKNPLTPRVIVNRVWLHHFGEGIVPTPSDFGLRSEPPSHPELLDYLAARFVQEGWSLKKLHRLILLSNVYQQKSDDNPAFAKIDPGNRLLWKMNRRRLDFEAMRDTFLASSGELDRKIGGQSVELMSEPASTRRTVYGWIDRMDVPGVLMNFDFANPDLSNPQRHTTTVPQQALFLMNSPFVIEQARALVQRDEVAAEKPDDKKIKRLYEILFQREPDRDELQAGLGFLKKAEVAPVERIRQPGAWKYGFAKYDLKTRALDQYYPLEFSGDVWRMKRNASEKPLYLTATGGRTDDKSARGVVRRWTAPFDGVVNIEGLLEHASANGAGVTGVILHNRKKLLGEWTAKNSKGKTSVARAQVKTGDTIDFVTRLAGKSEGESFKWSPVITLLEPNPNETPGLVPEWNAEADFGGPDDSLPREKLNAWARYAQVLLLANELVFVN